MLNVEIWSDVACPWCHIGKRRFERALAQFPHRDQVRVTWRSFELDPSAPPERTGSIYAHLAKKYRTTPEQARAMGERVQSEARAEGLDFNFDALRMGNTRDAHALIHFAHTHGLGDAMKERLLQAYFSEGLLPSDRNALSTLASDVGLDAKAARQALDSEAFVEQVRADELQARRMGVNGVPFFLFDGQFGASGAQPVETFSALLDLVWEKRTPDTAPAGELCDDEGCALPTHPAKA